KSAVRIMKPKAFISVSSIGTRADDVEALGLVRTCLARRRGFHVDLEMERLEAGAKAEAADRDIGGLEILHHRGRLCADAGIVVRAADGTAGGRKAGSADAVLDGRLRRLEGVHAELRVACHAQFQAGGAHRRYREDGDHDEQDQRDKQCRATLLSGRVDLVHVVGTGMRLRSRMVEVTSMRRKPSFGVYLRSAYW